MKASPPSLPTEEEIASLDTLIDRLTEQNEQLPEGVRVETDTLVHQLEVMRTAFHRDLRESSRESGADPDTAARLFGELRRKTTELGHELDALSQGAPTTIDAAADAGIRAVETVAKRAAAVLDRNS